MFGLFRTVLALQVMVGHLLLIPRLGSYAVFSFYTLSGFLMTMIMAESYGHDLRGRKAFAMNRFLRLYPVYWIAVLVSVLVIAVCGSAYVASYKDSIYLPQSLGELVVNLTMVFPSLVPSDIEPRLSPPTWALTVEITYYCLIGLGISRTLRRTAIWCAASVVLAGVLLLKGGYTWAYASIPAGSLPFAVGALAYHGRQELFGILRRIPKAPGLLLAIHLSFGVLATILSLHLDSRKISVLALYACPLLSAIVILQLFHHGLPGMSRKVDRILGNYSYPVYLLHWQLGALASWLVYREVHLGFTSQAYVAFGVALLLVFGVSTLIMYTVDPAINRLRSWIKKRNAERNAQSPAAP